MKTTTKVQHTPGPWAMHFGDSGDYYPIVPQDQPDCQIASVNGYAPTDDDMEAEGRANARLIAAAPDLLAACEYAEFFCQIGRSKEEMHTIGKRLRAAIAKATT